MNDPPGVPPPLGIEVVEWIAEGGENLTVRVTGRWRRRRPAWSGQPTLVIEAPGRRYRFPAMPEPPSLTGAAPGMWRISFAVPAALAPDLGGRAWLQFGAAVVPLPAAVEPLGGAAIGEQLERAPEPMTEPAPELETSPAAPTVDDLQPHPSSEVETEAAVRRAADAVEQVRELLARVDSVECELAEARAEADRLSTSLTGQDQARRVAEQRAHAERAQRLDLARKLALQTRERDRVRQALGDLATAEERIRRLERELTAARRRIDESEQLAAAATAARERAEERAGEAAEQLERVSAKPSDRFTTGEHERLDLERGLVARRAAAKPRVPGEPPAPAAVSRARGLSPADAPQARIEKLVLALRAELDQRTRAEAKLRAQLVDAEARLFARERLSQRTGETLIELRAELDGVQTAVARERRDREVAERRIEDLEGELGAQLERSRHAYEAIAELREELKAIRVAVAEAAAQADAAAAPEAAPDSEPEPESDPTVEPDAAAEPDAEVEPDGDPDAEADAEVEPDGDPDAEADAVPERLTEALGRLRDVIPPLESEPGPTEAQPEASDGGLADTAWLQPVFTSLAKTDPDRAGRLLVDLLPAQGAVHPEPLSYDLVLGGNRGSARVTVTDSGSRVALEERPRALRDVDFQVVGDYAAIARLLTVRRLRRRFNRHVARVRGDRKQARALEALVGLRLDLAALYREGVRIAPRTALIVTAGLIEPEWTTGVRFCIAYESPGEETVYLVVDNGAPVQVATRAPGGSVSTAISGQAGAFELLLTGARPLDATVTGDERPLTLVGEWLKRAQSG